MGQIVSLLLALIVTVIFAMTSSMLNGMSAAQAVKCLLLAITDVAKMIGLALIVRCICHLI